MGRVKGDLLCFAQKWSNCHPVINIGKTNSVECFVIFPMSGLIPSGKIKNKWQILNKYLSPEGNCRCSLWTVGSGECRGV